MNDKELIPEALRRANGHPNRRSSELMRALADRLAALTTGRAEIAEQVRRHCTLPSEVLHAGSDAIVRAVADWIENPPEWVPPVAALTTAQEGDVRARLAAVLEAHNDTMHPDDQKKCACGKTIGYAESGAIYRYEQEHLLDEIFAAFPALSRATVPDAATELAQLRAERDAGKQAETDRTYLYQLGLKLGAERDAALAAIERVRAINTGNNRALYGNDFEAGMAKALWLVKTALDGAPEPETLELFPGTNAALDRLTVRKAEDANAFCIEHGNFHAVELGDPTCQFEDGFGEPVGGETDGTSD